MKAIFKIILCAIFVASLFASCASKKEYRPLTSKNIQVAINSEPAGAVVYYNGEKICNTTPATVTVKTPAEDGQWLTKKQKQLFLENNSLTFRFLKPGYISKSVTLEPTFRLVNEKTYYGPELTYPDAVLCELERDPAYVEDPTIVNGGADERVSRDNAGETSLERTILRWSIDSDPRGARIFYRVISSVPSEVKNTNENYLTTTPYEETRSFNILGLTYANSRDVTIEFKISKRGYEDQIKRFNVRQAIDQQEINAFFELVPKEE